MKWHTKGAGLALLSLLPVLSAAAENPARAPALEVDAAGRFAALALSCIHKEYPNKIAHVMQSDADARPPHELTPAFYGCYDWHSACTGTGCSCASCASSRVRRSRLPPAQRLPAA